MATSANSRRRTGGKARIGTVAGRYYAMDRDRRWERTKLAWDALVHGDGLHAASATEAVDAAYARGESDEFIKPTIVDDTPRIGDGDAVVHMNFRADRARQLTQALALDTFDGFDRGERPRDLLITTLTEYQALRRAAGCGRVPAARDRFACRLPLAARSAPAAHRRDREVRARDLLLQWRSGGSVSR